MKKPKITVLGSFVVDLMSRTPHLPARGETVFGGPFKLGPGGKGSNQGVAAHKAGADVTMVTKLGRDDFAQIALNSFKSVGMRTDYIFFDNEHETGAALIMVENGTGENEIVVSIGACNYITDDEVESVREEIRNSKLLLTQLETNLSAVYKAIDIANEYGVMVVLNTAPVQPVPEQIYKKVDVLTPNETEASILSGIEIKDIEGAKKAAEYFVEKGVKSVVITLGSNGVYVKSPEFEGHVPAFALDNVIDTTGAGDAFNGGFATALAEGKSIKEAAIFGNAVAGISVTRIGTAPAMPWREEVEEFLKKHFYEGDKK
ncbi:ribokinase [Biomaibacter acetigenes]|jgi:ribokinase|uniref:Ribokinase n=1 Tax=Biomaibacter acetigenes TaxID=2316383 RepID=A0A3G2R342_9FIRM|nr:ribokinase [Biomaibacter acetigenes]AYO29802.1 ribokinase [Biomaibacter acetigenes]RKL64446.1 ribokinase [Thermoanaerobacteraceae bacterium SP2]